jgi:Holliday junction resolvase RusA-like endonuclease
MAQTLYIAGRLPGLNEITGEARAHRMRSARQKKTNSALVHWSALAANLKPVTGPVQLVIRWCEKRKPRAKHRDPDNICAGVKFILDGLVDAKVLPDDGWDVVRELAHRFEEGPDGVMVEIREMSDGDGALE